MGSQFRPRESSHLEGVRMAIQKEVSALIRKGAHFAVSKRLIGDARNVELQEGPD